jgi:hypothetical protein
VTISNLAVEAFLVLRNAFFNEDMQPVPFFLRDKRNTQDDPLDEFISELLSNGLKDAQCIKSPGPLISPDLTIYRPELCEGQPRESLKDDLTKIVAIEVKKLERTTTGGIARASGMDYNTTPPCGTIRVYDAQDEPLDIRGFYLFVAQEEAANDKVISALALCDGDILNEDFELYLSIVSQRQKEVGLGTYGDGANRIRPMLIFANPLGASELDREATVVADRLNDERVGLVYEIVRPTVGGDTRKFFAYRKTSDIPDKWVVQTLDDPFPQPKTRVAQTQSRGKFRVPINVR